MSTSPPSQINREPRSLLQNLPPGPAPRWIAATASTFAGLVFALQFWNWWTFQYRSFDLAFYVQSLWLTLHGKSHSSLLDVSLLGNHAEPIVYLLVPVFWLIPHPMTLVAIQTIAVASMPWTGWRIARRMDLPPRTATILATLTLLAPATGFMALHEFHPETLAAPLLLLLIEARLAGHFKSFTFWFLALVACKENLAILLVSWCLVHAWHDRRNGWPFLWRWNFAPMAIALSWLAIYGLWLAPTLNAGRVDYLELYSHLGHSPADIILGFFSEPQRALNALWKSLSSGNLFWGLLGCFAALPLLRPKWLLIASPILLQHLLSARSSEWTLYFHYAAPLLPLFWIATAQTIHLFSSQRFLVWLPLASCLAFQGFSGPVLSLLGAVKNFDAALWSREGKAQLVDSLAADPSLTVTAGLPYLSHLATRENLHSLHFVIKGLSTLSLQRYVPDYEPQAVLVDFADASTFNKAAGFYHPAAVSVAGRPLPSSDRLLHDFLAGHQWSSQAINSTRLYRRVSTLEAVQKTGPSVQLNASTMLDHMDLSSQGGAWTLRSVYELSAPREDFPWLTLQFRSAATQYNLPLGMCAASTPSGLVEEVHRLRLPTSMPPGTYQITAVFLNHIEATWNPRRPNPPLASIPIGSFQIK